MTHSKVTELLHSYMYMCIQLQLALVVVTVVMMQLKTITTGAYFQAEIVSVQTASGKDASLRPNKHLIYTTPWPQHAHWTSASREAPKKWRFTLTNKLQLEIASPSWDVATWFLYASRPSFFWSKSHVMMVYCICVSQGSRCFLIKKLFNKGWCRFVCSTWWNLETVSHPDLFDSIRAR